MLSHPDISVCGELANASKHGVDKNYHLGAMSFLVPEGWVKRITFVDRPVDSAAEDPENLMYRLHQQVELDAQNPEAVEYRLPMLDKSDNKVGDAFEYAERAITALEHFLSKIEK
jgi:hypothetical protein